jgi:DNA-binding IclR family transcriptional regulator
MHLNVTAGGKALMAFLPDAERETLLKMILLPRQLIEVSSPVSGSAGAPTEAGFAIDDEEDVTGIRCTGAPVLNAKQRLVAAISIAGTTSQITRTRLHSQEQRAGLQWRFRMLYR